LFVVMIVASLLGKAGFGYSAEIGAHPPTEAMKLR